MKSTSALLACVALAMTACSSSTGDEIDTSRISPATEHSTSRWSIDGEYTELNGDLVDAHAITYTDATVAADNNAQIKVTFMAADPTCTGYLATAKETSDKVTITLYEGALADAEGATCDPMSANAEMYVELDKPLDKREVIDGAKEGPRT